MNADWSEYLFTNGKYKIESKSLPKMPDFIVYYRNSQYENNYAELFLSYFAASSTSHRPFNLINQALSEFGYKQSTMYKSLSTI